LQLTLDDLTVLILTFNEEANIVRTLQSVSWAKNILVVDSFSSDKTSELLAGFPFVKVVRREFDTHADQWNYALGHVQTTWVLTLDADYVLPIGAEHVIQQAMEKETWGFSASFEYLVLGQPVRGSVLPPRTILFRIVGGCYFNDGHTQRLKKSGTCDVLPLTIAHDDRKPLSRWLQSQVHYANLEAGKIGATSFSSLGLNDRIRKLLFIAPPAVFLLVYIFRGSFLSGWRGLFYALQRFTAELLLSLFLIERIIGRKSI